MTGTQLELFTLDSLAAPEYIESDEYQGSHTVRFNSRKHRVATYAAFELATFADASGTAVIFESYGHVNGVERFCRTRYRADSNGNLHGYDSDGAKKIIHPFDRKLRVLTGK